MEEIGILSKTEDKNALAVAVASAIFGTIKPLVEKRPFDETIDRRKVFSAQKALEHFAFRNTHLERMAEVMKGKVVEGHDYGIPARQLLEAYPKVVAYLQQEANLELDQLAAYEAVDNLDLKTICRNDTGLYGYSPEKGAIKCASVSVHAAYFGGCSNLLARAIEKGDTDLAGQLAYVIWDILEKQLYLGQDQAQDAIECMAAYGVICLSHHLFVKAEKIAQEVGEELEFKHFKAVDEQSLMDMLINYSYFLHDTFCFDLELDLLP